MRHMTCALALALLAGCGKAPDDSMEALNVNVTAAPGVAFAYRYLYTIPPANIARVQEAHAQACERLGIARCRIVGMTYNVRASDEVDGSLSVKLEPSLARAFGRQGTQAAEAAEGMLSSAAIEGVDVGSDIAAAEAGQSALSADRGRLDRGIAASTSARERAELARQRETLDAQSRDVAATTRSERARLASTPVSFRYESGVAIRSLHAGSPLIRAADTALASLQATLSFVLQTLAVLLGPALAAALLWLVWRAGGRRVWQGLRGSRQEAGPA